MRFGFLSCLMAAVAFSVYAAPDDAVSSVSGANCTFQASPDAFLSAQSRVRADVFQRVKRFQKGSQAAAAQSDAAAKPLPRRNFIDDEIFTRLLTAQVAPANLTTDEEFFRRVALDLTGRIPSSADIRAFAASTDPGKRDAVIEQLLYSQEFIDKWTMWFGDLMQNNVSQATAAVNRQLNGRNTFFQWIYWSVAGWTPLKDMAFQAVAQSGNNYTLGAGGGNFIVGGSITGGPAQDTYDGMLVRSASTFLGMSHYDCLLCHNGRGHLDLISLWGSQSTRLDA